MKRVVCVDTHIMLPSFVQACIAPRLFSSFTLYRDQMQPQPVYLISSPAPTKRRPNRPTNETIMPSIQALQPILPFLQSLVDLESELLKDSTLQSAARKVHFAAFDGSAMVPPSDVMEGSYKAQHAAIQYLTKVVRTIEALDMPSSQGILRELASYLTGPFVTHGHCNVCAESLSSSKLEYPPQRAERAAAVYALDFKRIIESSDSFLSSSSLLSWNCRLADASAQLVRYWLRTELNPVPDRAPSETYTEDWNCRVCELVSLVADTDPTVAVDDGSLSSLVSDAASHVYHYFGGDWTQWKTKLDLTPKAFCQSELCQRGIASSGATLRKISLDGWNHAESEVDVATGFLAAVNGAKFLYELLTIVVEHAPYVHSWKKSITESAKQLAYCEGSLQSQDAHLILLSLTPSTLLYQLPAIIDWSRKSACQEGLKLLERKFLFGRSDAKTTRRKRAYQPRVGQLEMIWEQAMANSIFPIVSLRENDFE
jgi:hypothetical protein